MNCFNREFSRSGECAYMNENNTTKAKELVAQMTLEEKASLCSGLDSWHTKPVERLGIPSIMVSDGPHGLRKQIAAEETYGIGESQPATCFPTASALACSFDPKLAGEVGSAIAEECIKEDVDVLLGPGNNMKRSPLCGRNFEYYSEDPLLSGKMAAGFINGVQEKGIGACLKHFAVNNQEKHRMSISAVVDERALRETYLRAFEIAVKEAKPWTIMCSYNKINDVYSSENKKLLKDILRDEWGYQGVAVSDWGAVHLRPDGVAAGLDLEMPGSGGINDKKIVEAVKNKTLAEKDLDAAATNVVKLVLDVVDAKKKRTKKDFDQKAHHELAIRAATESMVLLQNGDDMLPLQNKKIAVIGRFAKHPRYQGAGSSKIHPFEIDSPYDEFKKEGADFVYASGEDVQEAINISREKDAVVIFAGLTEQEESEGFDRANMQMPENQNALIRAIAKENPNVCVVLMGGSPIDIPWEKEVRAILLSYLGGEGVGAAIVRILTGKDSPSGKLAETWPYNNTDVLSDAYFPGDRFHVCYRESIYTGYRYFDTAGKYVRYAFGHGLSYSKFAYSDIRMGQTAYDFKDVAKVYFKVKNVGTVIAKETSLVFFSFDNKVVFMPKRQLVGFSKQELLPGEEKEVCIEIDTRNLGYYNTKIHDFYAPSGVYKLQVGGSLEQLPLEVEFELKSKEEPQPDLREKAPCYYQLDAKNMTISDDEFSALLGRPLPPVIKSAKRPFTMDNCLEDTKGTFVGRKMLAMVSKMLGKRNTGEQDLMMDATVREMPFFALMASSRGLLTERRMEGILDLLNNHFIRGLIKISK